MSISIKLTGQIADLSVHRPADIENGVLSITILADPEDNNDLLNAMSALFLIKKKARIEIHAKEVEDG